MTSTFTKPLADLLRKVEIERRKIASDVLVLSVPEDIRELQLAPSELEPFIEYVNTLYADYSVSADLDFSGGDDEEMKTHLTFRIADKNRYDSLLKKIGVQQFPEMHIKRPTYQLENGLVIDSEQGTLTYKDQTKKVSMNSQSAKLLLALVSNNSGSPLSSEMLYTLIHGEKTSSPGMIIPNYKKNLVKILEKKLNMPKSEIDSILHHIQGAGYKNTLAVEIV